MSPSQETGLTDKVADSIFRCLTKFAASVTRKMTGLAAGEPEDQLRGPFEGLLMEAGRAIGPDVIAKGESRLLDRLGQPDYAVLANGLLAGYAELKAPGLGADPSRFKGHDRQQWQRFQALPNLLYCDGNQWSLYRNGLEVRPRVSLAGDVARDGASAVAAEDALALQPLLTDFLFWQPTVPSDPKQLADFIAPICRLLRDDVADSLRSSQSALMQLARDWRQLLFPHASDEQFADAYAQTVIFALLLARSEGGNTLQIDPAVAALSAKHTLLSRALEVLTDPQVRAEIGPSLLLAQRVIDRVPIHTMALYKKTDPWLYFYEDFLASYDPELRKNAGAYYTPVEVVQCQIRLVDELLRERLGMAYGFAAQEVVTLDPAAGTGTYLLGIIDHALAQIQKSEGPGAVAGRAGVMAANLYGFEIMVGPYSVTELRLTRSLLDRGASLPRDGPQVYLTDTLESPHTRPPQLPLYLKPVADQHRRALAVKETVPVIVCLGNPPYDRHEAADPNNKSRTGGWVRWGDPDSSEEPILDAFIRPAKEAGHGVDVKNLYNLYVYFWRWALWKVFEHKSTGPGIISFITASSYVDGDAFVGMREHMRRLCDDIWIIDIGGEGRGTRRTDNVFAIQTPVCIAVMIRYGTTQRDKPAEAHFARIEGTREEKLNGLDRIKRFADLRWEPCPNGWQDPLRPIGSGPYYRWPLLTDLFPWQHSGSQFKRIWPIAPSEEVLRQRWRILMKAGDRRVLFKETRDRKITRAYPALMPGKRSGGAIAELPESAPAPPMAPYAYRSFDRQFAFADNRVGDFLRPPLWQAHGEAQIYFSSLLTKVLGKGPALTVSAGVPDLDHFSGRGAKDIIPLYRDGAGREPNLAAGLLQVLERQFGKAVGPDDFAAYIYGVLAHPYYVERFSEELEGRQIRVPITKRRDLFMDVCGVGRKLLCLHTFGERFVPAGARTRQIPPGRARCPKSISGDPKNYPEQFSYDPRAKSLAVGDGIFAPVEPEVWEFEVSGLKVVQSWLGYRMRRRHGRHSSPLDEIHPKHWTAELTTELLRLLWVLEHTLSEYPNQKRLFRAVVQGPTFRAREFPRVQDGARLAPGVDYGQERLATSPAAAALTFSRCMPLFDAAESGNRETD
jgi:Type ISP C-terminal specificity domain/N-6 DNA Methylase